MAAPLQRTPLRRSAAHVRLFALAAALAVAPLAVGRTPPPPQISEQVAGEFGKLRELTEAKSYAPALAIIERLLNQVPADSYDRTLLSQIQAQIFLTEGNYADSIAPLEVALANGERYGHLDDTAQRESLFLLAQLYQQKASGAKDPAAQRPLLARAADYLRRWQARTPEATPDGQVFAASLFYQQATLDPHVPDADLLAASRHEAEKGLALQLDPPTSLYVLLLATLQQAEQHPRAADILELLVEKHPDNVGYWRQLASTYLTLAGTAQHQPEINRHNLRALLTFERAQARGLLDTPADHFNVVALHLGLDQLAPAIALLEKGLADGSLANTRRNWELLFSSHQRARSNDLAIAALQQAVTRLPEDGQLEFTLAQHLYAATRLADARRHLEAAIKKGGLENPGQTHLFLAYTTYELGAYDDARRWTDAAATFDDVKKDDLARLTKAIRDAERAQPAPVSGS